LRKPFAPVVLLRRIEQEAEIRRSDLFVGVEAEVTEAVDGSLADRVDRRFGRLALDFDELAEVGDGIERHGVVVEGVPLPFLFDDCGGREPEGIQNVVEPVGVRDTRLDLFAGFRRVLDQRPFVGDAGRRLVVVGPVGLEPDAERLVGFGEIAVRGVVVGVDLRDAPDALGAEGVEALPDRVVVRPKLQLDFVHIRRVAGGRQKRPGRAET